MPHCSRQAKTPGLKARIAAGESLDALVPEAFAVVREASRRLLGMRHFDVQLVSADFAQNNKCATTPSRQPALSRLLGVRHFNVQLVRADMIRVALPRYGP